MPGVRPPLYGTLLEETASDGSYTLYFYDRQNGFLLAGVQSDGNGTAYTYDSIGNLTGAYPITFSPQTGGGYVRDPSCTAEVSYTYDAAMRLSGIAVGGVSYTFAYDNFGNPEGVSVAGHGALVSYTYGARNGKPETLTYENGLTVRYTYDALDRVSEIGYRTGGRDVTAYRYTYAATGWRDLLVGYDGKSVTYDAIGNPRLSRILVFPISGAMLTYDLTCDSYMGIVNEVLTILSAILGILRARREQKRCTAEAPASRAA